MIKEPGKIINLPGFYYFNQLNPTFNSPAINHRNIPGVVQRPRQAGKDHQKYTFCTK
ncbi:Uncharacterised protein [Escherichia coli]|nr:Uncharacterised protein [Escherichia coli]